MIDETAVDNSPSVPVALSGDNAPDTGLDAGPIVGMAGSPTLAAAGAVPTAQPTAPAAPAGDQPRMWQRILFGALIGAAGGAGQKTLAGGIGAGARTGLAYQDQQAQNAANAQKATIEAQKAADAHTAAQDTHNQAQANMAMFHVNFAKATAEYDQMPKTLQDKYDQSTIEQGQAFKSRGIQPLQGGDKLSYQDAVARQHAEMGADKNTPLNTVIAMNPDKSWSVYNVPDPNKLNDNPVAVTIGYNMKDGSPIKKNYPAGTISLSQQLNTESTAITKHVDDANAVEKNRQETSNKVAIENSPTAIAGAAAKAGAEQKAKNEADMASMSGNVDSFGNKVGITPEGQQLGMKEYNSRTDKFSKDYVQPLNVLAKTNAEFDRINANPNQTGAEKVTALLNAVGISGDPLKGKGFRISNDVINEHAQARNIWESGVQKLNNIAGSGGPITSQQIKDYTTVAQGVVHDAYVTAAQEARRQGLPVNFLPKPTAQNQKASDLVLKIYADSAGGDVGAAHKALTTAGWR